MIDMSKRNLLVSAAFAHAVRTSIWSMVALIISATAIAQSPDSAHKSPIGMIGGQPIYEEDLAPGAVGQLRAERQHQYELTVRAIQDLAMQKLLDFEAKKKGIATEKLLQNEVDNKVGEPTPGELEAFYLAQREHSRPFEEVKGTIREELKRVKIQTGRENFVRTLQQKSEVMILVQRPRTSLNYDPERLKGPAKAPVMIIEFSDFSCPFCRQAESTLKKLSEKYRDKVSVAYRDFPLREKHSQAQIAAEAAHCAAEQNRFWEYHDLLFDNANRRDRVDLLKFAEQLALNKNQFDSCLSSGKYKPQIDKDVQDAVSAGVAVTPVFFINGIFLAGAQPASEFEKIIEEELRSSSRESARN